ncbi:MAG: glycosyltransferase family 4 protein, partial [Bdellovibrionota bacterium]
IEYRLVGPVSFFPFLWFLKFMALWLGVRMIWRGSLDPEGLAQEYQNADLFALTSVPFMGRSEAFGFVYLEAGLFRLPLLGHKIGGVEDIIVDGQTGFLCEVNQTKELSDRILLLIKDADLRKRMGDLAHERSKQFTWKRFVSEFYPRDADLLFQMPKVSRE